MENIKYLASLDENGIVDRYTAVNYSHQLKEYSIDKSITNNEPFIGARYDEELNAFIPPSPDPTYILDTVNYEWHPNPTQVYNITVQIDEHSEETTEVACRWSPKLNNWIAIENWSDEEHL